MRETPKELKPKDEFEEKVIQVDRVSRTVAGGRRLRFRVLIAVGNRAGQVGIGVAKGPDVASAVTKAKSIAKKHLIRVFITNEQSIKKPLRVKYGSACILMQPARRGTSIVAGGSVRSIVELAGIKNINAKILGSANKINNARATILALQEVSK